MAARGIVVALVAKAAATTEEMMALAKMLSTAFLALALMAPVCTPTRAQAENIQALPAAVQNGGMPLMQALKERRTTRKIGKKEVDAQNLSNLLWAAFGINRPDGKRTVPTALNQQAVHIYVMRADGIWEYLPKEHALKQVADKPLGEPFNDAPLHLLYAAPETDKNGGLHVGSVYQNAGLYCTSAGLANSVKNSTVRNQGIFSTFLPKGLVMLATQSVGWPL